jgi:uncharacterized protein (DUF1810 family)
MGCVSDASSDPWRLERFVAAQDRGGTYRSAVAELRAGAKVSHWMWFIFPQVTGLGMSAMSREYAISSDAEARAYLAHPVLGPRLRECARIVADTEGRSAEQVFGYIDAVKLRSSMTLFAAATQGAATGGAASAESGAAVFREVLGKYFGGVPDKETLARLPRLGPCGGGQPAFPFDQLDRVQMYPDEEFAVYGDRHGPECCHQVVGHRVVSTPEHGASRGRAVVG